MASEREKIADKIGSQIASRNGPEHYTAAVYLKPFEWRTVIAVLTMAPAESKDREDGAREMREQPRIQEHRVVTLRYMLERAKRMSRCFYRAGNTEDAARYREEADALTYVLAALPLTTRTGDGDA